MKKHYFMQIFSMVLALILAVGALPITGLATTDLSGEYTAADWEDFDEFSSSVSKLLSETMEDDYISSVTLEVGSDEMVVDGVGQPLVEGTDVTTVTKDDVVMLPVQALPECEDAAVIYDTETSTATVQTEDKEIVFTQGDITAAVNGADPAAYGVEAAAVDDGEAAAASNGEAAAQALTTLTAEPEVIDDTLYVPLDTMASFLGYDMETVADNKLLLTKPYQTKRLIVKSKEKKLETHGAVQEISGFNDLHILQYETEDEARDAHQKLLIDGEAEYVEPDSVVSTEEIHYSWGTVRIGADTYNNYLQANTNLDEVVVAVVDTGADSEHTFLKDRIIPVNKNFVNNDPNSNDGHSHGTHVSGIIVDATLPNVKILPVKSMGDNGKGTSLSLYNGVMFSISQNCDVINMSLGGAGKSNLDKEAVEAAVSENISVVVAAGNDSLDAATYTPAGIEEAVTVGAVTKVDKYASYSNYGTVVDIWAPGSSVNSSVPGNKFEEKSGTSMAAPHVAAAAAMLKTYDKTLSPRQIEGALQEYAKDLEIDEPNHTGTSKVLNVETLTNFRAVEAVEKPKPDMEPGDYYQEELVVSLSCTTPGATIRYTTDGTEPTATDGEIYTEPLTLRKSTRLIAKAFKEGALESYTLDGLYFVSPYPESLHYEQYNYYDTWTYTYPDPEAKYLKITFDEDSYVPFPSADLTSNYYSQARLNKYGLYIYDAKNNAVNNEYTDIERNYFVYDELQGKSVIIPGNSFTILLNCPHNGSDYGFKVKSVEPLYETRLSAPEFVTPCGNEYYPRVEYANLMLIAASNIDYAENKTVVLSSLEDGDIYYTLDGSVPTKNSLKYTGPIALDEPKKIRARAYKDGYVESAAVSENYYSSKYPETMHYQKRDYYYQNGWEWQAPSDVKYMAVTFDDKTNLGAVSTNNNQWLNIYNAIHDISRQWPTFFYGTDLAGQTIYIKGNYFKLFCGGNLPEGTEAPYGFKITDIQYYYNEDDIIPIESIEISGPNTITEGKPTQMTAKVMPENANIEVIWRIAPLNSANATIDNNGVITGINRGEVMLCATSSLINSIRGGLNEKPDYPDYIFNGAYKDIFISGISAPTGTISYSTTSLTNRDVVATITTNSNTKVTNNGGSKTHTFTENGEFTFELLGSSGKTASVTAKVDWIDKDVPTATLTYSTENTTNGEVLITMQPSEEVTVTNTKNNSRSIRVTENGPVRFEFVDAAGNIGFAEGEVTWIDKSDISAEFVYEDLPDGRVKATLQTSKPVTVTNNGGSSEYIFSANGSFTFEYQYDGGKTGSATANVCWLYQPIITYDITTQVSKPVTAVIELPPDVIITNNGGKNSYVFNENGSFTFEFEGFEGHKGRATAEVTWIVDGSNLEIYAAEDLVAFAEQVRNGDSLAGGMVRLMQDIDMSGIDLTPVGDISHPFDGTFDGQNFTIYNLSISSKNNYTGLFARIGKDAVIHNVRLVNCSILGRSASGGIVGMNSGIVENCSVSGEINGASSVGGIVGRNPGSVRSCCMTGTVIGITNYVGGIVGSTTTLSSGTSNYISNCSANVLVYSYSGNIGGITGGGNGITVIENCCSAGKVQGSATLYDIGGITGSTAGIVRNSYSICSVENITANGKYCGGISGFMYKNGSLENCVALNPYVLSFNTEHIGRITGDYVVPSDSTPNITNNYAWSGMLLGTNQDKAPVADSEVSPYVYTNGKGIDRTKVFTKAFWEAAGFSFDSGEWTWNEGKMPSLSVGEPFDWPEWLLTGPEPTAPPTAEPTASPTAEPTASPTAEPTASPTAEPTASPTAEPTAPPTAEPTAPPTAEPTASPTAEPTAPPTAEPTASPTAEPTAPPTAEPTASPTASPEHIHHLVKIEARAASCTDAGNTEYWKCEGANACNKMYSDADGTAEITEIPIIPAAGHNEVADVQIDPTCETDGKTAGTHCSVCQAVIIAQQTIPKLNHDWGAWSISTEPTLTTTGTAERICGNDNTHKDNVDLPVLTDETVWTAGARIEPTETANGSQVYNSIYGTVTVILPATADKYDYRIKYENGKAVVTVPADGTYTVIFAAYDNVGILLSVSIQEVQLTKGENPPIAPQNFNANGNVNVMLWDSLAGMKPLAKTAE